MIAIVAEKPSLARNIAAGLGKMENKNGYLVNDDYIVTWAFGHLFSLCDVEDYSSAKSPAKWTMEGLPCFPERFKFKLKSDRGVEKQFSVIKTLLNRQDVDKIVNAGDSDREGEIIIRLCISNALTSPKPVYRLWLPDQTPETVKKALSEMKSDKEYENLASEGFSRTYIDWLYGVNLTRYASIKTGSLLRVGRVIVPIVKAVYDRDSEIENFKPETYFALASEAVTGGEKIELVSKYRFPENEEARAAECCRRMNLLPATVTDKTSKKEVIFAGKLFSLTKLQNAMGKKYKMPMERSLAAAQKLYESGYISYPRTNSEYLATNEKDKIKSILKIVEKLGYEVKFKESKSIFDDSKIESHSALTPTYKIPDREKLTEDEKKVYQAIIRRFAAVFCNEDCVAEKTEITISLGGKEDYALKGTIILQKGWTKYDGYDKKDKLLPDLKVGDEINVDFKPVKKQTSPPKHYTIETLNNYLKNPFKDEKAPEEGDEEEYKAIFKGLELGTEATRTGIIDNAIKNGYISLNKDVYKIENNGKFLIEQLSDMDISMDKYKTSELGQALKKVYRGEISIDDSVDMAKKEIKRVFDCSQNSYTGFYGEKVCRCPKCGGEVVRGKYSYGCTSFNRGCDFKINVRILGATIGKKDAESIATTGKSQKLNFVSKSGKAFSCALKLTEDMKVTFDL